MQQNTNGNANLKSLIINGLYLSQIYYVNITVKPTILLSFIGQECYLVWIVIKRESFFHGIRRIKFAPKYP